MGWEKYDKWTNNGFPPNTCGGCGSEGHYRNNCPDNPNKGKYPPRKGTDGGKGGKAKGKGKGKWGKGKGVGGVDDYEYEATGEEHADDGQQVDEGGSVWEDDDPDCGWAVDDETDEDNDDDSTDVVYMFESGALHFPPSANDEDCESSESGARTREKSSKQGAYSAECRIYSTFVEQRGGTTHVATCRVSDQVRVSMCRSDQITPTATRIRRFTPLHNHETMTAGPDLI